VVYLEFGLSAFIQLHSVSLSSAYLTFNSALAALVVVSFTQVLVGVSPFLLGGFVIYNRKALVSPAQARRMEKWKPLFNEFIAEKGVSRLLFYPLFFLKRFIYLLVLVFASEEPGLQIYLTLTCSLLMLGYLSLCRPFRCLISQIANVAAEVGTVLALLESSLYLHPAVESSALDWCLVLTVCVVVGLLVALSVYAMAKNVKAIAEIVESPERQADACHLSENQPESEVSMDSNPDEPRHKAVVLD
jgi:hypothetical protein